MRYVLLLVLVCCIPFTLAARLPSVSGDDGTWGALLNDFLNVSLAEDGTLRVGSVDVDQIRPDAVSSEKIQDASITSDDIAPGVLATMISAQGGITSDQIAAGAISWMPSSMAQ